MEKINIHESYDSFVGHFKIYPTQYKARAKGYEAHHIIPQKVQKREKGKVYDDRCIRVTYFEHILAHYLYCKEHPEDIHEHIALERMCNTRAKELLTDEKKFLDELPQMAEMREKGVQRGDNHYMYGKHRSEESKKKQSESLKGKYVGEKNPMYGKTPWNKGIHCTDEQKKNISEKNKGRHPTEEQRKKQSEAQKGRKFTEDHKRKISESRKGEKNPYYGKHLSEEHRMNISKSHMGEKNSSAHKVFQRDLEGNIIQVFSTIKEAHNSLGIGRTTIGRYLQGQTPKNLTYTLSYN